MWCVEHCVQKVAFGAPLQEHLRHAGADISVVIEQCVMALLKHGLNEEVIVHCFLLCIVTWDYCCIYNILYINSSTVTRKFSLF